jgi:mono/diheme cytochrome c family protein
MSEEHNDNPTAAEPKTLGVLAQFPDVEELVAAARRTTDEGYRKVDAFSPFPLHDIDAALRAPKTVLPWLVFLGGLTGCLTAIAIQFYMNGVEFPFIFSGYAFPISAKPLFSLPANVPIIFELIILFSSLTAFFGMLALNDLPKLHNPLFRSERFGRATNDGFFLWVDAKDEKFDADATSGWFSSIGAQHVETIPEVAQGKEVPAFLLAIGAIGAAVALVPPLWVAAAAGTSTSPRLSIWWDMDYQAKFKPQTTSDLFPNGRAMRVAVPGTVARGTLRDDRRYYEGIEPDGAASRFGPRASFASAQVEDGDTQDDQAEGEVQPAADGAAAADATPPEPNWTNEYPARLTENPKQLEKLMARGQQRFNIYCATCHGRAGYGEGLVTQRALSLNEGTWTKPLSLHDQSVREQPVGRIYNTITNGIRKMPGYSRQINVEDRWAIALYVRALQRSQHASLDDIPEKDRP